MITDDDVAMVLRAYAAFARGDIGTAVADLAPDVEWVEPDSFPYGGARHGPAEVADYLRASYALWSRFTSRATPHIVGGRIVVVHHVEGVLADGTPNEATVADAFTVADGRVTRMTAYADPADALS